VDRRKTESVLSVKRYSCASPTKIFDGLLFLEFSFTVKPGYFLRETFLLTNRQKTQLVIRRLLFLL